jgi:hypothetical protein
VSHVSGFGIWVRVEDCLRIEDVGCTRRVWGSVWGSGLMFRIWGLWFISLGFGVHGLGFRV